jgi:hypothetical protein
MQQLIFFEKGLADHFSRLADERPDGQVFLIEHGLDPDSLQSINFAVGERGGQSGFDRQLWNNFPFCLCVSLTEFGYRYSGNDFWPMAERGLKAEIRIEEREHISAQFRSLHQRYGIAKPLDDRWTEAFGHIAWPIRNAMVPLELHSGLARVVREALRHTPNIRMDGQFLDLIRGLAEGMKSRRLDAWLADDALATAVIRSLISGSASSLSVDQGFLSRLEMDLRANDEVRKLSLALRAREAVGKKDNSALPRARLQLLLRDAEPVGIAVRGPILGPIEKHALYVEAGAPLTSSVVTFGARSSTLSAFLDGETLFLGRPASVPDADLTGLQVIPQRLAVAITPSTSLLFLDEGDDGYQPQIQGLAGLEPGKCFYELRFDNTHQEAWDEALYHFTVGTPEGDERLKAHGLRVSDRPLARFFGGMTLSQEDNLLLQTTGRILKVQALDSKTELEVENTETGKRLSLSVPIGHWIDFPETEGYWTLEFRLGDRTQAVNLQFRSISPSEPVRLRLQPEEVGLSAVGAGEAEIEIWAPVALHDLNAEIEIASSSGEVVRACIQISAAPTVLGLGLDEFTLVREAARLWADTGMAARMRVRVPGLGQREWLLPSIAKEWRFEKATCQWLRVDGVRVRTLVSDPTVDPILFEQTQDIPICRPVLIVPETEDEGRLSSAAIVMPTGVLRLGDMGLPEILDVSRLPLEVSGRSGLIRTAEALIMWRSAIATSVVAEALRGRVTRLIEDSLVSALCGNEWLAAEKRMRNMTGSFYRLLAMIACEKKLAMGDEEFFSYLPPEYEATLIRCLEAAFRSALPLPETIIQPDSDDWEELDNAVNNAWEDVIDTMNSGDGPELWSDANGKDRLWHKAIDDAREASRLPQFLKWLLPKMRAEALVAFDYEGASFSDMVAELEASHQDISRSGGRWITSADMRALLLLFMSPMELTKDPDWRGRIARFGSERFAARAVRYAALRNLALRQGNAP